jgi:hypothetical protein
MALNVSLPAAASLSDNFSAYPLSEIKSTKGVKQKNKELLFITVFVAFLPGRSLGGRHFLSAWKAGCEGPHPGDSSTQAKGPG